MSIQEAGTLVSTREVEQAGTLISTRELEEAGTLVRLQVIEGGRYVRHLGNSDLWNDYCRMRSLFSLVV